jgi:hypothetical protein
MPPPSIFEILGPNPVIGNSIALHHVANPGYLSDDFALQLVPVPVHQVIMDLTMFAIYPYDIDPPSEIP